MNSQRQTKTEADKYNDQTGSEGNTETKYTDTDEEQVRREEARCINEEGRAQRRKRGGKNTTDRGRQRGERRQNLKDTRGHGKSKHETQDMEKQNTGHNKT